MLIGADPEFELHNAHGFVSAAQAFIHAHSTQSVGLDGCSNTGEFRPQPGTPAAVTASFRHHLSYLSQAVGNTVQAYAGSGIQVPTGGHIHFSGVPNTEPFRNLLDRVIAVPLNKLSKPDSLYMRTENHHYGVLSSYREQPWGWEYRAPLSWICHPIVCRGTLELAWQAATLFLDTITSNPETSETILNSLQTPTDLLSYVSDKQASLVIEKFFDFTKEMKTNQIFLEDFELFQSWKIRKTRFSETFQPPFLNILQITYPQCSFSGFPSSSYILDDREFLISFITSPVRAHYNREPQINHNNNPIAFHCIPASHRRYINGNTVVILHGHEELPELTFHYDGDHDNRLPYPYSPTYSRGSSIEQIQQRIWSEIIPQAFAPSGGNSFEVKVFPSPNGDTEIFFPLELMSIAPFQDSRFPAYLALYLFGNPSSSSFLFRGQIQEPEEPEVSPQPSQDPYLENISKFLSYKPKRSPVCVV